MCWKFRTSCTVHCNPSLRRSGILYIPTHYTLTGIYPCPLYFRLVYIPAQYTLTGKYISLPIIPSVVYISISTHYTLIGIYPAPYPQWYTVYPCPLYPQWYTVYPCLLCPQSAYTASLTERKRCIYTYKKK
jgi:hypothetical protein